MSIFENMNPREIAICLSAFYEGNGKVTRAFLCSLDRVRYVAVDQKAFAVDQKAFDEGIKILREDYEVFWTPDTKPDDLKWKINKRRMNELAERIQKNSWYGASTGVAFDPGRAVINNDWRYRGELGLPDNATVEDICKKIRRLMDESCVLNSKVLKLEDADRLRRHWHSKYEDEHKECVRLSKLHAADKEKKDKQDVTIRELSDNNTTLGYSVAALKKRIRSMEAEAQEKETKNKVIIDTLRDNLVDSVEECKRLKAKIRELDALYWNPSDTDDE